MRSTLGPIIGGYLSDPEDLLSGLIKVFPYLKKVPFSIPLCISGLLSVLCCSHPSSVMDRLFYGHSLD